MKKLVVLLIIGLLIIGILLVFSSNAISRKFTILKLHHFLNTMSRDNPDELLTSYLTFKTPIPSSLFAKLVEQYNLEIGEKIFYSCGNVSEWSRFNHKKAPQSQFKEAYESCLEDHKLISINCKPDEFKGCEGAIKQANITIGLAMKQGEIYIYSSIIKAKPDDLLYVWNHDSHVYSVKPELWRGKLGLPLYPKTYMETWY